MRHSQLVLPNEWRSLSGSAVLFFNMDVEIINLPSIWLSATELSRLNSITDPEQARFYRQSRLLLRYLLGHCLSLPPESIQFSLQLHGKPRLGDEYRLEFNLSHSKNWLAIAISTAPVGVDIEYSDTSTNRSWLAIAKRFFHQEEYLYLKELSESKLVTAFSSFWTQKEAVLKANGTGLNAGLNKLNLLTQQHILDNNTYYLESGRPVSQLQCTICTQGSPTAVTYYIVNEQLEIQPIQPPYISHLCLKPNSL